MAIAEEALVYTLLQGTSGVYGTKLVPSAPLRAATGGVSPHVFFEGTAGSLSIGLESSPELINATSKVAPMVLVEYAQGSFENLLRGSAALMGATTEVGHKVLVEYAAGICTGSLSLPQFSPKPKPLLWAAIGLAAVLLIGFLAWQLTR